MKDEQKLYYEARRAGYFLMIVKDTATYWLGEWVGDRYRAIWVRDEDNEDRRELTASEVREIIAR